MLLRLVEGWGGGRGGGASEVCEVGAAEVREK